jgi:hypothetical protein
MKLRLASSRIAEAVHRLAKTSKSPATFGRIWRRRMLPLPTPTDRAASTNSLFFSASVGP